MGEFKPVHNPSEMVIIPLNSEKTRKDAVEEQRFEEALERQRTKKTDADQKKQKKQEQEKTEGLDAIFQQDIDLSKKTKKTSLYDVQPPKQNRAPSLAKTAPSPSKKSPSPLGPSPSPLSDEQEDDSFVLNLPDEPLYTEETTDPSAIVKQAPSSPTSKEVPPFSILKKDPPSQDKSKESTSPKQEIDTLPKVAQEAPRDNVAPLNSPSSLEEPKNKPSPPKAQAPLNPLLTKDASSAKKKEDLLLTKDASSAKKKEDPLLTKDASSAKKKEDPLLSPNTPYGQKAPLELKPALATAPGVKSSDTPTLKTQTPNTPAQEDTQAPIASLQQENSSTPPQATTISTPIKHKEELKKELSPPEESEDLPLIGLEEPLEEDVISPSPKPKSPKEPPQENPKLNQAQLESEVLKQTQVPLLSKPQKPAKIESKDEKTQDVEEESAKEGASHLKTVVSESKELQKDKEHKEDDFITVTPPAIQALFPAFIPMEGIKSLAYSQLPSDIFALFEQFSGNITVMESRGDTKTSFILDGPRFNSSIFYGSQITISAFASAPKEYNIEFSGSEEARKSFDDNKQDLEDALNKGGFSFRVKLIQTSTPQSS